MELVALQKDQFTFDKSRTRSLFSNHKDSTFDPVIKSAFKKLEGVPNPWAYIHACFFIVILNKLGIYVSGGEEQYLAFAKQFVNPDWIPNSFSLTEYPGSRLIFQWIVGHLMGDASFEAVVFVARLLNFALLAIPFGMVFRELNIRFPAAIVMMQLFVMSEQNLMGGEWIVRSFEPKSVAYIFVISALLAMIRKKIIWVAIFLALAAHFHILVAGWTGLVFGVVLLWNKQLKSASTLGILFSVLMIPFGFYLFQGYFGTEPPLTDLNVDQIYAYYRLPNHLGVWKSTEFFLAGRAIGTIISAVLLILGIAFRNRFESGFKVLNQVMIVCFSITLLFVGIAAIDHFVFENSGGLGLKYYPFRSNSLGFLCAIILSFHFLFERLQKFRHSKLIRNSIFGFMVVLTLIQGINNVKRSIKYTTRNPDFKSMAHYAKENTKRGSVFLILQPYWGNEEYYAFNRMAERENFIVPKFVSAEQHKLLEWYERNILYMRVRRKLKFLEEAHEKYGVTHFITNEKRDDPSLELMHQEGEYLLYRYLP